MTHPRIGVFSLQGDVREHLAALTRLGTDAVAVRRPEELTACEGIVLPGGESTTMGKLARTFGLLEPLRDRIAAGMPALGTCAGMILLADRILDGSADQESLGGIDMTVRRNAFGRQVDSFESDLDFTGIEAPVHAVFIRAPWVEQVGPDVEVLAQVDTGEDEVAARVVAVRQGALMATSFHPEIGSAADRDGGDDRIHRLFVDLVHTS